jgi:hypothetical protein
MCTSNKKKKLRFLDVVQMTPEFGGEGEGPKWNPFLDAKKKPQKSAQFHKR